MAHLPDAGPPSHPDTTVPLVVSLESTWDPTLVETLYELLYWTDLGSEELDNELARLEERFGNAVYSELIYLLSHLRFDEDEARTHWQDVIAHRDSLVDEHGAPVDLRVALVSYFVQVNRRFKNPKVIELRLFEQTQESVYRDDLTGLHNYRLFRESLAREIERSSRCNTPMSLVMLDVDDFKFYNDRHGHEAGNEVLRLVAMLLGESLRKIDVAARYGGEEFALILPDTFKTGAQGIAENLCAVIADHPFPHGSEQPSGRLSVSVGVATYPADAEDTASLIRAADRAMYVAKAEGKNRVEIYGDDRRSYRRIQASLQGSYRPLAADSRSLATLNLSEGGVLFLADRPLTEGALIEICLELPGTGHRIGVCGRVVGTKEEDGKFETSLRIVEMADEDRARMAAYLQQNAPPVE